MVVDAEDADEADFADLAGGEELEILASVVSRGGAVWEANATAKLQD